MSLASQNNALKKIIQTIPFWGLAYLLENVFMADLAAIISVIFIGRFFFNFFGNQSKMIEFLKLGALFLVFSQNLSWLIASGIHHFFLNHTIDYTISKKMGGGLTLESYFLSIIFISLFCAVIVLFSELKKIKFLEKQLLNDLRNYKHVKLERLKKILIIITIINLVLIFLGFIGQRAILTDVGETVRPLWVVLYTALIPAQTLLISLCIYKSKLKGGSFWKKYLIVLFASIPTLYIYFSFGRRMTIFAIFSFVYWYFFFAKEKPVFWKTIVIVAIVYPILSQILIFNNFLRGGNGVEDWSTKSAIELLPMAWEKYTSSDKLIVEEKESSLNNLSDRPLVAAPLALCIQYPIEIKKFTYGENFFNSLIWAIPGGLVNKTDYPIQEELLYRDFKIGRDLEEDAADSTYLVAYTEFGWLGIIIYGLFVCLIWFTLLILIQKSKIDLFFIIVSVSICFELMIMTSGEGALNAWFVSLRSALFFIFLAWIFKLFKVEVLSK